MAVPHGGLFACGCVCSPAWASCGPGACCLSLSLSLSPLTSLCIDDGWLGAVCRWTKQLEGKGGLRSVVRETAGAVGDSAGAIGLSVQDSLRGLVAMRSYRLHIPPGEILLAEITIDVVAKDGTMASLLQAIRERLGTHTAHTALVCTAQQVAAMLPSLLRGDISC
jgi:hypothetical protein